MIKIKSYHRLRKIVCGCEIKDERIRQQFDWMDDEEFLNASFFRFRKVWYTLSEFAHITCGGIFGGWDKYNTDSFLLVKFFSNQFVKVAIYYR